MAVRPSPPLARTSRVEAVGATRRVGPTFRGREYTLSGDWGLARPSCFIMAKSVIIAGSRNWQRVSAVHWRALSGREPEADPE